jgi:hypothetical protein
MSSLRRLAILLGIAILLAAPGTAPARPGKSAIRRVQPEGMPRGFWLPVVRIDGREYYRTLRVTSTSGLERIMSPANAFRFFSGDGQYGEAFYLFRSASDARKFVACERQRGAKDRNVIAEVLLPKDKLDAVAKKPIPAALDWAMQLPRSDGRWESLRQIRLDSHLVFGR